MFIVYFRFKKDFLTGSFSDPLKQMLSQKETDFLDEQIRFVRNFDNNILRNRILNDFKLQIDFIDRTDTIKSPNRFGTGTWSVES